MYKGKNMLVPSLHENPQSGAANASVYIIELSSYLGGGGAWKSEYKLAWGAMRSCNCVAS